MNAYTAMDNEGLPMTTEQHIRAIAEQVIAEWVETAARIELAGLGNIGNEPAIAEGVRRMRHLALAEPWLPAGRLAKRVAAEVLPIVEANP